MTTSSSIPSLCASEIRSHVDEFCHILKDGMQGVATGLFSSFCDGCCIFVVASGNIVSL